LTPRHFEAMPHPIGLAALEISCQRGGRTIYRDLSFRLAPGEALLVTGPNGAGKTSLLRQIAGLLPRGGGALRLEGGNPGAAIPELCHYVGHANAVKASLRVAENLDFWAEFLGDRRQTVAAALAAFGLAPLADLPAGLLSAGQKRRLALARLLVATRPIWLLDEPQSSLDKASLKLLDAAIEAHLKTGGVAVVASHAPLGTKLAKHLTLGKERVS
jgi:heme exporter protein A